MQPTGPGSVLLPEPLLLVLSPSSLVCSPVSPDAPLPELIELLPTSLELCSFVSLSVPVDVDASNGVLVGPVVLFDGDVLVGPVAAFEAVEAALPGLVLVALEAPVPSVAVDAAPDAPVVVAVVVVLLDGAIVSALPLLEDVEHAEVEANKPSTKMGRHIVVP